MKNTIRSIRLLSLILSALLAVSCLEAEENPSGYLFYGAETSVSVGRSYFPILTVDKRKIHVESGTKVKKVPKKSICQVVSKMKVTNRLVEVLEMDWNTWSMTNLQRSSEALSDMELADASTDAQIAGIKSVSLASNRNALNNSEQSDVDDIESDNNSYQKNMRDDFDSGSFELDELVDTVDIKGDLLAQVDIPGAYCVLVVTHERQDYATGISLGKARTVRAQYLGDLVNGKIFNLKARLSTAEFDKETAEYELHLYDGDGSEIAMSTSRGLKPLTGEQYQKVITAFAR